MSDILSSLPVMTGLQARHDNSRHLREMTVSGQPLNASHKLLREKAEEFEQGFLTTMLESMFKGVETSAPFGGGHAEKQFRSLMLDQYSENIVKSGGIGVADEVYRELLAIQEGQVK